MTDEAALHEIAGVLAPEPAGPPPGPGLDWTAAESRLGLAMPTDYRAFIDRYGGGSVDGFLHVFHPAAAQAGFRLGDDGHLDDLRDYGTLERPYPLWPEADGLLPFARTLDGDHVYWQVAGDDPDGWTVVLTESLYDWWEHEGGTTRFLADVLVGRVAYPVFPDDWPLPSYTWEPFALLAR